MRKYGITKSFADIQDLDAGILAIASGILNINGQDGIIAAPGNCSAVLCRRRGDHNRSGDGPQLSVMPRCGSGWRADVAAEQGGVCSGQPDAARQTLTVNDVTANNLLG
ncbi:hypothetical protein ACFQY4_19355 [Catellatospora bangladeshensis]|uniref:hypothetical protein n=1 Tax=Catellatospora bangladeshensis TaxID=310355 RepID=UPI0036084925